MTKVEFEIEVDADVLAWFQAQGDGWQEHMNAVLKSYVETHKRHDPQRSPASLPGKAL